MANLPRSMGSDTIQDYTLVEPQNDGGLVAALQTQPVFVSYRAPPHFGHLLDFQVV